MPRPPRKHIPGAFYHITQRGNNQQRIFFSDGDRVKFCHLMQEGTERFDHRIHAFCLMDNHVHLLIQAGIKPLGKAMQNLTFRFAKRLNKKFNTTGHRFQGRYFSGIIDTDEYLHEVLKYIHLNPVRANMVDGPSDYVWSSHNFYLNKESIPWVHKDFCLNYFSAEQKKAMKKYQLFMSAPQNDETILMIGGSSFEYYIGDDDFIKRMENKLQDHTALKNVDLDTICIECCKGFNGDLKLILGGNRTNKASFIRGIIGYIIDNNTEFNLSDLARYCHKSQSAISRSVKRVSQKIIDDPLLKSSVKEIVGVLDQGNANPHT